MAEFLAEEGLDVRVAGDGWAALELLRQGLRPDVIVLDLVMPRLNGWEFRQKQLDDPALRTIPTVVTTTWYESVTTLRVQLKTEHVFQKPAPHKVVATIRRLVSD